MLTCAGTTLDQNAIVGMIEEVLNRRYGRILAHQTVAHMEWALLDKPGVDNLVEIRDTPQLCASQVR